MSESGPEINLPSEAEVQESNSREKPKTLFRKIGSHLVKTGQIATFAVVLATACDKGEKEVRETATPEYFPPGVTVPTNTPLPSETALETPTITQVAHETPTQTPETSVPSIYSVNLSPELNGTTLESGLSATEFQAHLQETADNLPKLGNVKILIYKAKPDADKVHLRGGNYFIAEDQTIYLDSSLRTKEIAASELIHEFGHYLSTADNGDYLKTQLTEAQFHTLENLYQKAIYDNAWGMPENQNVPEAFFNTEMLKGTIFPTSTDTADTLIPSAKKYMYSIMLTGRRNPEQDNSKQVTHLFQQELAELETYSNAENLNVRAKAQSASEIISAHKDFLDKLSSQNPLVGYGIEKIKQNPNLFTPELLSLGKNTPSQFEMAGFTQGQTLEGTIKWGTILFVLEGVRQNDPELINILTPEQVTSLSDFSEKTEKTARSEGFAEQLKIATLTGNQEIPAQNYINYLKSLEAN